MFQSMSNIKPSDNEYYKNFIDNNLYVVTQCSFELPRQNKWNGQTFYFDCLQTIQKINKKLPDSIYELLSTSLWYNKHLKMSFDCELSKLGFNCIRDLLCEGEFLSPNLLSGMNIPRKTKMKLSKLWERLPDSSKNIISEYKNVMAIPFPQSVVYINNSYRILKDIQRDKIYDLFIDEKFRMPVGMHKWINMFDLSGERVENAFTFARTCTLSTISRVFQYKIATCTLPTEEYLWTYQIRDNYYCKHCLNSTNNFSLERELS